MQNRVKRVFVEKKKGFDVEAQGLYRDLKDNLGIKELKAVRILNRYDVEGISDSEFESSKSIIFSEPPVDAIYDEKIEIDPDSKIIAIEYLPGQYDQRADSASQCIQILTEGERPDVRAARIIILDGNMSEEQYKIIKDYCINPVECQQASLDKPLTLKTDANVPEDVKIIEGFINMEEQELKVFMEDMGFAMSLEDLIFCRKYFRDEEKRDPSVTEIRLIDTYWSDHCRHTTFLTSIENVEFGEGPYSAVIKEAYDQYIESRNNYLFTN